MKNIFLILIASLSFIFCKAQVPANAPIIPLHTVTSSDDFSLINNGSHYKDTENRYQQWVGTWQYQNGNTIFKIVIQKIEGLYFPSNSGFFVNPINCYVDVLVGTYYYEVNGVVLSNHLTFSDPKYPPLTCAGTGSYPDVLNNKLFINYREYEKAPNLTFGLVNFSLLPGSTTLASWAFDSVKKRNYSVPDNVILTKL